MESGREKVIEKLKDTITRERTLQINSRNTIRKLTLEIRERDRKIQSRQMELKFLQGMDVAGIFAGEMKKFTAEKAVFEASLQEKQISPLVSSASDISDSSSDDENNNTTKTTASNKNTDSYPSHIKTNTMHSEM